MVPREGPWSKTWEQEDFHRLLFLLVFQIFGLRSVKDDLENVGKEKGENIKSYLIYSNLLKKGMQSIYFDRTYLREGVCVCVIEKKKTVSHHNKNLL